MWNKKIWVGENKDVGASMNATWEDIQFELKCMCNGQRHECAGAIIMQHVDVYVPFIFPLLCASTYRKQFRNVSIVYSLAIRTSWSPIFHGEHTVLHDSLMNGIVRYRTVLHCIVKTHSTECCTKHLRILVTSSYTCINKFTRLRPYTHTCTVAST